MLEIAGMRCASCSPARSSASRTSRTSAHEPIDGYRVDTEMEKAMSGKMYINGLVGLFQRSVAGGTRKLSGELGRRPFVLGLTLAASVSSGLAGCSAPDAGPTEDVGVVRSAEVTSRSTPNYTALCQSRGVPLPPNWGGAGSSWIDNGTSADDGYFQFGFVHIYYSQSTSPPGLCVLATRQEESDQWIVDVICQGANSQACFWEGYTPTAPPPATPTVLANTTSTNSLVKGGSDLGTAGNCTSCHAGENVFINHAAAGHPTNLTSKVLATNWMPATWPNPIVDTVTPENAAPDPMVGYPASTSGCPTCHTAGGIGGRFPKLSAEYGSGYCALLQIVANRPASQDGMPPLASNICTPDTDCALQTDPFVKALVNTYCAQTETNLARNPGTEAYQSSTWGSLAANFAIDGNNSADFNNDMAHTNADPISTLNSPYGGSFVDNGGAVQNSLGTMTANDTSVFVLGTFGGSPPRGASYQYNFNASNWTSLGGGLTKISVGRDGSLWGINSDNSLWGFDTNLTPPRWIRVSTTKISQVAGGDGTHPWVVDLNATMIYRMDDSGALQPMFGSAPWPGYVSGATLKRLAVGTDDDAWALDSTGNVLHYTAAGWVQINPFWSNTTAIVRLLAVTNANNVWVGGGTFLGLFNYNPVNVTSTTNHLAWQHHCPAGGCTLSNSSFTSLSVDDQNHSVWATVGSGATYTVDQNLLVNHADSNSTDNSLFSVATPAGGFAQVLATGANQYFGLGSAFGLTSAGETYTLTNYAGVTPLSGGAWWYVDLGDRYHVDQIKIYNRDGDCGGGPGSCAARLSHFRVNYWNGSAWTLGSDQSNTTMSSSTLAYPINVNFDTEYVMIQKTDSNFLTLSEVEVLGPNTPVPQR